MKNPYLGNEIEALKSKLIDSKQIYQKLLRQTDSNVQSFIKENSKLRQEIKDLKQIIKNLESKGKQNVKD